jgi:hypothetical protein
VPIWVSPNPNWAKPSFSGVIAAIGAVGRVSTQLESTWQAAAAASTLSAEAKAEFTSTILKDKKLT